MKKILFILFLFILSKELVSKESFFKNDSSSFLSTIHWLKDDLTLSFIPAETKETEIRDYLSGIRFLFEPAIGTIYQGSVRNQIVPKSVFIIPKYGFEVNVYKSFISVQFIFVNPSTIEFDEKSDFIKEHSLNTTNKSVSITSGFGLGLSLIDGIVTIGFMQLNYDQRDFKSPNEISTYNRMLYINLQPVSLARAIIKMSK